MNAATVNTNTDQVSYVPVKSKLQHPPPPPATPRAFELLKIGLFKFPPLGEKSRSNAPPFSSEIPLLKDKFLLQSNTVHFSEGCAVMTPSDFF